MTAHQKYIVVAGNMGVGKSTMVQFLTTQFGGEAFYEPVDKNPYLARFFKDMKRWAFHSQMFFLTHKFRIHEEVQKKSGLLVVDRSIYEDAEIFARGLHRSRKLSKDEFAIYWELYQSMCRTLRPPDLLIYLTCSMKTLKSRVIERGRSSERSVSINYLRRLQRAYDKWVSEIDFCEVLTIKTDDLNYIGDLVHRANIIDTLAKYL